MGAEYMAQMTRAQLLALRNPILRANQDTQPFRAISRRWKATRTPSEPHCGDKMLGASIHDEGS